MHELPKQYDHTAAQARCRALWDAKRTWHAEPAPAGAPRPVFSIVIPPLNVKNSPVNGTSATVSRLTACS